MNSRERQNQERTGVSWAFGLGRPTKRDAPPVAEPPFLDRPYPTLTAALMGDPRPGQSALDEREGRRVAAV